MQLYWSNPQQPWRYVSVAEFAEHFRNFSAGREIALRLATPPQPAPLPAKHSASGHEEVRCGFCVRGEGQRPPQPAPLPTKHSASGHEGVRFRVLLISVVCPACDYNVEVGVAIFTA